MSNIKFRRYTSLSFLWELPTRIERITDFLIFSLGILAPVIGIVSGLVSYYFILKWLGT